MVTERTREERQARLYPEGVHVFDLDAQAGVLRGETAYQENGRDGITLVKNPNLRVVVEALRAGAGLAEHHAPGPITVHVLQGELRFNTGGEAIPLRPGEMLALPAGQPHSVHAVQDTTFLITIAPLPRGTQG
ncbi:MAG TPA: cupin domain-containing protein [Armatimonadota bacterium]|nr:cupin domain-containing protein [Armatimonadota bacterium]